MKADLTKIAASIFVWLIGGFFSLFAVSQIVPVAMEELGYIPLYGYIPMFMPVAITSIMLAKTLMDELPKTKRFNLHV